MPVTFARDIQPKIRPQDITCMTPSGIALGDAGWMCDPAAGHGFGDHGNARKVYAALAKGVMPPDAPWPKDWLATYQAWMDGGFQA